MSVSEECTEEVLQYHEQEVEKVKEYYHQNKDMLEKVARRQKLWGEFQEFEVSCQETGTTIVMAI